MRKQNRKQNRIKRAHGLENHAPLGLTIDTAKAKADIGAATRRLNEHRRATVKEHHFLDGEMLKLNGEIRRFETMRLFGLWLLAAATGLTVVVWLCVTYGLL
jgi:hypothetical protein